MNTAVRIVAAFVPLLSGAVVARSSINRVLRTAGAEAPKGWRWQIQGPFFSVCLSPLLLASRSEQADDVRVLVVAAAVSLVLLFPVASSLYNEDAYYDMFRPRGGTRFASTLRKPRVGLSVLCWLSFTISASAILWVVAQPV